MGAVESKKSVRDVLAGIPLTTEGLLSNFGDVITIDSNASLTEAYQTLLAYNITSAPVFNKTSQDFVGMLDIRDLAQFAVLTYEEQYKKHAEQKQLVEESKGRSQPGKISTILADAAQNQFDSVSALPKFDKKKPKKFEPDSKQAENLVGFFDKLGSASAVGVGQKAENLVVSLCARNSFRSVPSSASLLEVCEVLATGVHSVPVMEHNSKTITNLVTQSSVIRFLRANHSEELQGFLSQEIGDLGSNPVIAVGKHYTVYCALKIMTDRYITGVAVVDTDNNNKLCGTFSTADLKGWFQTGELNFETLTSTVWDFLANRKMYTPSSDNDQLLLARAKAAKPKEERPAIITCIPTETLSTLVHRLDTYKIHRIYITHALNGTVESVVCLKDLLRLLVATTHLVDKTQKPTSFVCECHHCKGHYSFENEAIVIQHLDKYGKYDQEWASSVPSFQ